MSPITHFLAGWLIANAAKVDQRERALVALAGVIPDMDGLVVAGDLLTRNSDHPLEWWGKFHHVLGHNIGLAILMTVAAFFLARRRKVLTAFLAYLSFHLHLLGDLVGARGPEGYQWPISYLLPFSDRWQWVWEGQWALNAWPNFVITILLLGLTFYLACKRGYSPLEMVSARVDKAFVQTLQNRFQCST